MTRNQLATYLILIGLILTLVLFSGCDILLPQQPPSPTATSTQTMIPTPTIDWFPATPTPTSIPAAIPTTQPTREGHIEGITDLLISDDFSNESLWLTSQYESGNAAFGTQNLTLAVAKPNSSLLSLSKHTLPENFYLELTIQSSLCSPEDQIGIVFWYHSTSEYYLLLINCTGQYRLELLQGGQNAVIYDWDSATQMQLSAPATNRVGIWVYEGLFQLFINDTFQFEELIAREREGALGVFARTISGSAMTVRFSDLQIFQVEMK
ncbi:MAG: hypothetical protein U9R53_01410 [Chloroflexota bacterium]|nr:hypothetical protein [Chloroflexota bacterium]